MSMTREAILDCLRQNRERIRTEFHAEVVGLFGSYSRGDEREDSDVDVLVEFDDEANFLHLTRLGFFLEDLLHLKVDIASQKALRPRMASVVARELIAL
ncbi:MAG: nucleotidyltransferase family protein [FCB group bacterium]|jgi:predicted nucleotidyltransferase|nr:nucleotidyltransferase family protein [FCB group bacterium]